MKTILTLILATTTLAFAERGGFGGGFEGGGRVEENRGFNAVPAEEAPRATWAATSKWDSGTTWGPSSTWGARDQGFSSTDNFDKNFQTGTTASVENGQVNVDRSASSNFGSVNKDTTIDNNQITRDTTVTNADGATKQIDSTTTINRDGNADGFNGYRAGYVFNNGSYNPVALAVGAAYLAPMGAYAGWGVVTQPDYVQYPTYASYPVETAVEIALTQLGFFQGEIDGSADSVAYAIEAYQQKNNLPVTGQITSNLLAQLGITCQLPQE